MSRIVSISAAAGKRPEGEVPKTVDPGFDRGGDVEDVSHSTLDDTPVNILIVDDEPKNLVVLETILDDPGYRLVRAESAEQALLALLAEEFALLILDIRMPGVTGFELARMVKTRRKTAAVPIIFLTAYYNEDRHVIDGYGSGAVDYLHKPIQPAILRSKVSVFVDLYRKRRNLEIVNSKLVAEVVLRRHAEEQLLELNNSLEQRIFEQTNALRGSMQRLQAINDGSLEYMCLLKTDGTLLEANRGALEFTNVALSEMVGRPCWDTAWYGSTPEASNVIRDAVARTATGEQLRFELTVKNARQEAKTLDFAFRPVLGDGGDVELIVSAALDITERKVAEQSVRNSERRLRETFENLPAAVYGVSADGRLMHFNPACVDLAGAAPELGVNQWCVCRRLFHGDGAPMPLEESPLALAFGANRSMQSIEMIIERPDGSRRWVAAYPTIMRNAEGDIAGGVNILVDITDRKLNEERIGLLMNEVDHRCKNILSVVQAIARQTALGGVEEFMPRFLDRIMALAASHDLLVESRWRGAELAELIRAHLLHLDGAFRSRVTLKGKPFRLSNAAAQTIGIIVHELATNAVKYGALSDEAGRIEIAWGVGESGDFSIAWAENGGPPLAAPTRRGFGSTVITAMAEASFAGKVDLAFESEGLHWRLICPAAKMLEKPASA